ncbi:MAG: restriction endonuclease subunit S [Helicobacteraceae bacterium]|jgi:type I restriction enzyme S subunit|nr:restriction endonuclease subunit S [Helicobacteraceae bacterium]
MSGWFGMLPEQWKIFKINELFTERREKVSDKEYAPLSVSKGGIVLQISTVAKTNAGDNRKRVCIGDFVINSRSDRRGSSGVSKYDGSVSLINIVLSLREQHNPRYFHYLLRNHAFIEEYYRYGRGIVADLWTTRYTEMKTIYLPLPPRAEQDQIVGYLNWKVLLINRLIAAKQRQIALLAKQKQAIINNAVTRGNDGWRYTRLINLVASVKAGSWGEDENGNGVNLACIRVADFDFERLRVKNTTYTIRNYSQNVIDKLLLSKNDILIEKSGGGDKQPVGRVVLFDKDSPALYANFIEAIRSNENVNAVFLVYLFAAMYYNKRNRLYFNQTTGIQNLDVKGYLRESVSIPPLTEQHKIVAYLDEKCAAIDRLIVKLSNEITLFTEYRARLISDVVTGKLDVRAVAIPKHEMAEESITADNDESFNSENITED